MSKRKLTRYWQPFLKNSKHLYLITNGHHYKLGITKDIEKRVKEIQTANATKVKLVKSWSFKSGKEAWDIEGFLLESTEPTLAKNEWFEDNRCRDLIIKEINTVIEIHLKKEAEQDLHNKTSFVLKNRKILCENEVLLIVYLLENYRDLINDLAQDFHEFIQSTQNEELSSLQTVIKLVKAEDTYRKELPLFAKAMLIGLNLRDEEVVSEFTRAMDKVRLEYEPFYTQRLIDLAEQKQLTQERRENLQKLFNFRDNNSETEERLIDLLNHYS